MVATVFARGPLQPVVVVTGTPSTPPDPRPAGQRRAVILVGNPANPYSRAIRLGRVAASMDPVDIAAAVRAILDLPVAERDAWRQRIATTARERYSWPIAAQAYRGLVASLDASDR